MKKFPLQLDHYFFTHQQATANPDFIQDVEKNPIHYEYTIDGNATRLTDQQDKYGISAHIELNQEKSVNPPYYFSITAFGIISIKDNAMGKDAIESIIETSGVQLLLGAIRERLADMTARGPWNIIHLDFIPISIKLDSQPT